MQTRKIFYSTLLAVFLITTGLGCKGGSSTAQAAAKPVRLEYWSVAHDSDIMDQLIKKYRVLRPYVTIHYTRLRPEEFEQKLLEALAEDKGPDIMSLHNTWISKYQSKLLPMPASLSVAKVILANGEQQSVTIEKVTTPTVLGLDRLFVNAVKTDVVRPGANNKPEIYGLPLSLDTMVLYYNQDLLDQANIPQPPSTWAELQADVVAATRYDASGKILQAGGALGTGKNVERSGDIITALMMQNGAKMADSSGRPTFHLAPAQTRASEAPVVEALRFYTDFANPGKEVYTWNQEMEKSFDAFTRGKAAFFFGYAYHIPKIKAAAPKLNYRILSLPQLTPDHPKNIANYWVESVSKKTASPNESWDFINFITKAAQADFYTDHAQKPTALRASIAKQLEDPSLAPFATQVLTAESWYRGKNPDAAETALEEMIDYINDNRALEETQDIFAEAINRAISKINQTL